MSELPLDQQGNDSIPLDEEVTQVVEVESRVDNKNDIYLATGRDDIDVAQAKSNIAEQQPDLIQGILDEAFKTPEMQAETLQRQFAQQEANFNDFMDNPDFYYEQALAVRKGGVSEQDVRAAVNSRIEQEIIAELKAQEDGAAWSFGDAVMDFGAMVLRESTIGAVEALTDRTERRGTQMLANRLTMSPNEYRDWFRGMAQEAREEGLRENNAWSITQLEDEVNSNGFDKDAGLKKAFALLDIIGMGEVVGAGLKFGRAAAKSTTDTGRVASMDGIEAANETVDNLLKSRINPQAQADAGPGPLNPHKQPVSSSEGWYAKATQKNDLYRRVDEIVKSGAAGREVPEEVLQAQRARFADEFEAKVGSPTFRTEIRRAELGRYLSVAQFGKAADGMPFKPTTAGEIPQGAKNYAKEIGGEVVPVDADDATKGYVIEVKQNIDTSQFIGEINPDELLAMNNGIVRSTVGKLFGNSWMASNAGRGVERLTALAQMGEGASAAIKREFMVEAKKINKLNATERAEVNNIVGRLRDDPVESQRRSWYTPNEFSDLYLQQTGKRPSQSVTEAYEALVDISDTAAIIKANNLMGRYLRMDYKSLDLGNGITAPGKQIDKSKLTRDNFVFDSEMRVALRPDELGDEITQVWKLDKPVMGNIEYVVRAQVKELEPQDVMGYNAGGSRVNPQARFFVTLGGQRLKALLTTFTEKQAKQAIDEITELRDAMKSGRLTDEVVENNNTWNPNIQTVRELDEFMKAHKWELKDGSLGYKSRDGEIIADEVGGDSASVGMRASEYIDNDMRRGDTVLPDFGGGKAYNVDPITAVAQQFGSAALEISHRAYTHNAMVGWVKEAQRRGRNWFPDVVSPNDYRNMFLRAEVTGSDDFAKRMREIRDIEMRRMGAKGAAATRMEQLGFDMATFVHDKTGKKLDLGDPTNALLTTGYQSAFGFFNVSQTFIQGSHAMTIMAASPKAGFKGAGMAMALRTLYHMGPEVAEQGIKRAAKHYDMTPDELKEIMEYMRTSGRDVIDGDAIESGTGVGYGISGFGGESYNPSLLQKSWLQTKKTVGKGLDAGLTFFNMGERLARSTGIYTAILEWKAKNPNIPLSSDAARRWITRREQDLTFNMTTSSRPMIQSGLMRVPTQWLSHTFRAMETIFVGRNFTKAERARMAAVLFPMYGLAGFGAANSASYFAETFGIDEDSAMFTTLKWGVIDGAMDWLLPEEEGEGRVGTGLAPRLTVVGAVVETYRLIREGQFAEAVAGPSGGIAAGIYDAFVGTISDVVYGRDTALTEDVIKLLRQPSGVDNVAKAIGIFNNGVYRSKNGVTIPGEMTPSEGILQLMGIGSLKQTEWYAAKNQMFRSSKKFTDYRKEINREAEVAFAYLQDPETQERGIALIGDLHKKITFSGFPPQQVAQLRKAIGTKLEDEFGTVSDWLMETERRKDQQRLGKVLGKFD